MSLEKMKTVVSMLQTFTGFTLAGAPLLLFPGIPICVHKIIGVNVIVTSLAALLNGVLNPHPYAKEAMMDNFYFHIVPLVPAMMWYRHVDRIVIVPCVRRMIDVTPEIRVFFNALYFLVWALIPWEGLYLVDKINRMYHHPDWWMVLVLLGGWGFFQIGLGVSTGLMTYTSPSSSITTGDTPVDERVSRNVVLDDAVVAYSGV